MFLAIWFLCGILALLATFKFDTVYRTDSMTVGQMLCMLLILVLGCIGLYATFKAYSREYKTFFKRLMDYKLWDIKKQEDPK